MDLPSQAYLNLVQIINELSLDDPKNISFAKAFLSGAAAAGWFTRVASNMIPSTKSRTYSTTSVAALVAAGRLLHPQEAINHQEEPRSPLHLKPYQVSAG